MFIMFYFFKQMTAYEMRISDWSSDVCSSDLRRRLLNKPLGDRVGRTIDLEIETDFRPNRRSERLHGISGLAAEIVALEESRADRMEQCALAFFVVAGDHRHAFRSEEHTSELQSLMRISYAVFCLKKKKT